MATLAIWLVVCFILSLIFSSRPAILASLPILMRLAMPTYASNALIPGFHFAGYMAVVAFIVQCILYWPRMAYTFKKSVFEIFGFSVLMAIMLINTFSPFTPFVDTISNMLVVYTPPFLLYLLIKMAILREGYKALRTMGFAILLMMIPQFFISIQQDATGMRVVYEKYAENVSWWVKDATTGSAIGLVEGHLEFTSLCSAAIALTILIKRPFVQIGAISMLLYSAVLATGRASILISIAISILVIILSSYKIFYKLINLGLMMAAGVVMLLTTNAGERLLSKVENDGSSTELRVEAYRWVWRNYHLFIFGGYPGDRDFRSSGQLGSSLENAYLIQGVHYGLIFGLGLLLFHLLIALRNMKNITGFVVAVGALAVVVSNNTQSGFSSNSVSGYLILIMLGLSSYGFYRNDSRYLKEQDSEFREVG